MASRRRAITVGLGFVILTAMAAGYLLSDRGEVRPSIETVRAEARYLLSSLGELWPIVGTTVRAGAEHLFAHQSEVRPIIGIVRATEIRVAPEVGGKLAAIKVHKGDHVRAGDVVTELSALELTAAVMQARAALAAASAQRDHVYAGVRAEEVATLAAAIAKAKARLVYAEAQLSRT